MDGATDYRYHPFTGRWERTLTLGEMQRRKRQYNRRYWNVNRERLNAARRASHITTDRCDCGRRHRPATRCANTPFWATCLYCGDEFYCYAPRGPRSNVKACSRRKCQTSRRVESNRERLTRMREEQPAKYAVWMERQRERQRAWYMRRKLNENLSGRSD